MNTPLPDLAAVLRTAKIAEASGDLDEALRLYETTLAEFLTEGGEPVAELQRKIGLVYLWRGNSAEAQKRFVISREVAIAHGLQKQLAAATNALAAVYQSNGQLETAESLYHEAFEIAERIDDAALAVNVEQNLGTIANIRGDCERALERYQSALARYRAMGDTHGAARVLNNIGMAYVDMQRWEDAETAYDQALFSAEIHRDAETLGTVQLNRAELYVKCERYDDARTCCDQAFEIFGRIGSTSGLGETYKVYGAMYRASGKLHLAEAHLALVAELAQEADHPLLEAEAQRENALVLLEQGRKAEALKSLNRAHRLFTDLKARHALIDLDRQLDDLERSYMHVVKSWAESIESKDEYTAGHCARVADYTCALARACGITGRDLSWIRMGAFLHDVGKTAVSAKILNKKGRLTDEEWQLMRAHTTIGDEIVAGLDFPYDIRPIVRSHHERWAGGGYPDNLSGEDIPLIARILCIADVFDALTTDRSYRAAYGRTEALNIMAADAGTMLDPGLFELFRNLIESHAMVTDTQNSVFAPATT